MAKEWILNSAMNRFQFNFSRNVGAVAKAIRECSPKTVDDWREYYYTQVRSHEHIDDLGRRLYVKITEVIRHEIEEITIDDCIRYMHEMVVDRTYQGYYTEITTVYGQLQAALDIPIQEAPDDWDRLYNVDFFIKIGEFFIGIQIKPVNDTAQISQIYKERSLQKSNHLKFAEQFGGRVFYVFSAKTGSERTIANPEVIEEMKFEIERLKGLC